MRQAKFISSLIQVANLSLLVLPLMLATPSKALGYADPGTGAFLYQAAYVAFLGGSFYLRKLLDRCLQRREQTSSPTVTARDTARRRSDSIQF
jgi:hypothetical protein